MAEDKELKIRVCLDDMTIGDLEALEESKSSRETIDLLQRFVPDTDIRKLPVRAVAQIRATILTEVQGLQNAKN